MAAFDSVTVTNILLACIALFDIVIIALLYERFRSKK
jgi:hypothetical protein